MCCGQGSEVARLTMLIFEGSDFFQMADIRGSRGSLRVLVAEGIYLVVTGGVGS